jgi:tRNA nucleotidyltransferase domain 2 putative
LHRLDCLASHGMLDYYYLAKKMIEEIPAQEIKPPRLLSGHDLIREGYSPGPDFKEILQAVEDAQLEGQIGTKEAALHLVRENFPLTGT